MLDLRGLRKSVLFRLFDALILPVAAYGSQVWLPGTEAFRQMAASLNEDQNKSAVDNTSTCLSKIATDPIQRLHLSFLKWTMGVNKYTSNAAVWGDTGHHPLAIVLTKQVFAYLHRVQQMDTDDSPALVRHVVKEQENLNLDWFSKLQALKTGLMNKYSRSFNHLSRIRFGLKVWFEEVWNITRVLNRKLGFYNKVKESFGPELYLSLKLGYFENKRVAQLRSSSHQYNIETGRHGQNREIVVNLICTTCSKNDDDTVTLLAELPFFDPIVEDETHVIQTCPLYEDLRKKLKAPT